MLRDREPTDQYGNRLDLDNDLMLEQIQKSKKRDIKSQKALEQLIEQS